MSNYIKNGVFNHQKWQRETLSEGPGNDPMLKSLRTVAPGEEFPETSKWWIYEPRDIMTYIYWHQGKMPPEGAAYDKEWKSVVKQLHAKYPIPADVLPKANLDRDTMDAIMHDAPRAENVDRATMTEALARGLKPLLMVGSTISKRDGEDALIDLSDKFDSLDDGDADMIASHLDMAIELHQDGYLGDATKKLKQFNKACKDALRGKPIKSAFENNDPAARFKKLAGMKEGIKFDTFKPGDMWSDDFDYTGMLRWGANAPDITFDNLGEMEEAHASFTDVNYHTEGADLGNAIEWATDDGPDEPRVLDFMKSFRAACAKTLAEIERR